MHDLVELCEKYAEWKDDIVLFAKEALGYELNEDQVEIVTNTHQYFTKSYSRISGKTTAICILALHTCLFNEANTVVLMTRHRDHTNDVLRKLLSLVPAWIDKTSVNLDQIRFANKSLLLIRNDSVNGVRGVSYNLLLADEVKNKELQAWLPAISAKGKVTSVYT
jgi:hypothetical protein